MSLNPLLPESCMQPGFVATDLRRSSLHRCVAPDFRYLMAACRIAWPIKTAETLAAITGASLRSAKYWLALEHAPRGIAAVRLLRAVRVQLEERMRAIDLFGLQVGK